MSARHNLVCIHRGKFWNVTERRDGRRFFVASVFAFDMALRIADDRAKVLSASVVVVREGAR